MIHQIEDKAGDALCGQGLGQRPAGDDTLVPQTVEQDNQRPPVSPGMVILAEAGVALTAVICNSEKISPAEKIAIHCQAADVELLFADWLNAIIYEMSTGRMVFGRYEVNIDGGELNATAWGEKIDHEKHETAVEVKAATYALLKVAKNETGQWMCQCVVDV